MTDSNTEAVGDTGALAALRDAIEYVRNDEVYVAAIKAHDELTGERESLLAENKRLRELLEHVNRAGQLMQGCSTCAEIRALEADLLNPPEKDLNQ